MPAGLELFITAFLGLCLGSFATALSWRLPRGESIVTKTRSACPACGHALGARDLVPLLSWALSRGRCRHCGASIGARYPVIELATLALCLGFYSAYGFTPQVFALLALAPVLVAIVDIDLRCKIIPDSLNLSVLACGVLAFLAGRPDMAGAEGAAGGALAYGAGALALRLAFHKIMKREPMGLGDVKFFAAAGFWLGPDPMLAAWFMALSGAAGVVFALAWQKASGEREFPFGPALVAALAILILRATPFLP